MNLKIIMKKVYILLVKSNIEILQIVMEIRLLCQII